ncbi:MAG: oligosaccharide flippase family protein [Anaerolineales bacterium]
MTAPSSKPRSSFFTSVLKLVSGTTVAQAITILTAPIISRLFVPETFGVLNVFTSMVTIISIVICLRYEFAIVLPEDDADAANLVGLCIMIALGISVLIGLVLLILGKPLVNLLKAQNLFAFLWLIPISLLIQGFFQTFNYWNTRTKHFGRLSIARVSASVTTSALPMLFATLGQATGASLIFSYVAGTFVFMSVLGVQVLRDSASLFYRSIQRAGILINLKRYRKFPLIDSWSSFINNLSWQLPSLMLLYFFSETVVGYYSLSSRLILLPLTLLGSSIAQVFYQRSAELRTNPANLARSVELVFHRLAAIGLFPALVLAIAGPQLFSIVFGANWIEAGRYTQILSPWMFILFISSPISNLFAALERQELALIINIIILITRFTALVIGGLTHNIFTALIIWSATGVIIYGGLLLWLLKLTHVKWAALYAIIHYCLYASLPVLVLVVGKNLFSSSPIYLIMITLVVTIAYYAIVISKDQKMREYLFALIPLRKSNLG